MNWNEAVPSESSMRLLRTVVAGAQIGALLLVCILLFLSLASEPISRWLTVEVLIGPLLFGADGCLMGTPFAATSMRPSGRCASSYAKGVDGADAAWQHPAIESRERFSQRHMMRTHFINVPTPRLALGPCFAQGAERLSAKDGSLSGRTTE